MAASRPNPLQWLWYAFGGRLPARLREWVHHDVTCRTWWLRHLARSLAQLAPFAVILLAVLGISWITWVAVVAGVLLGLIYSVAYIEETCEHRLIKHGYPAGTGRAVRSEATAGQRDAEQARYDAIYRNPS